MNGSRGDYWVRGCVIYFIFLVAENYVTNCCRAGADFILFGTGAELFMRIRSRIIIFEDPEPNYYEVLEPNYYEDLEPNYYFCINNNNFIFRIRSRIFNNKNLGISFEDPEPDCYFVKKNNIYFNNVRVLSESNMRFIIRIIIG